MTEISNKKDFKVDIQIVTIEILNSSMTLPLDIVQPITKFNFNMGFEIKSDPKQKFLFCIINVEVRNEDQSILLGSIQVSCVYNIQNFEEVVKSDELGKNVIDPMLVNMLNSITVSTIRGVMFSTFKGTFLHGAIIPIIDPSQIKIPD